MTTETSTVPANTLTAIRDAMKLLDQGRMTVREALAVRDHAVQEALAAGAKYNDVAAEVGLSLAQLHSIRKGQRRRS